MYEDLKSINLEKSDLKTLEMFFLWYIPRLWISRDILSIPKFIIKSTESASGERLASASDKLKQSHRIPFKTTDINDSHLLYNNRLHTAYKHCLVLSEYSYTSI